MRRDPMEAVLHVREVLERRCLVEEATARQTLRIATEARQAAEHLRDGDDRVVGAASVDRLRHARLGGLARGEAVDAAVEHERATRRAAELAGQRRVEAAVSRRSAERLRERRADEAAANATRAAERQLDAVALETWRRRR